MLNLNEVRLAGNLVKDAVLRQFARGSKAYQALEFRLAVSRKFKKSSGDLGQETLFIDVNLWGARAAAIAPYMTKGKNVYVSGRLQLNTWKKDGKQYSRIRVTCENIEFVGPAPKKAEASAPVEVIDGAPVDDDDIPV